MSSWIRCPCYQVRKMHRSLYFYSETIRNKSILVFAKDLKVINKMKLSKQFPKILILSVLVGLGISLLLPGGLTSTPQSVNVASASSGGSVLVGAGDIANCLNPGDKGTAALLAKIPGTIFTAGDDAYPSGSAANFTNCFNPTWGAFKSRIRPAIGNHEVITSKGAPYYAYFGAAAGPAGKGYYSYNLGSWHIIVLNAECSSIPGGCKLGSPQELWLKADLASHPVKCTLAIWHQPRFSSGDYGDQAYTAPFWNDLYAAGADVVINGHDHDYERFAPQNPSGKLDNAKGIREFVAGTGGGSHTPFKSIQPNSQVRIANVFGVLEFHLASSSYTWQFIPSAGQKTTGTDSGSATCH